MKWVKTSVAVYVAISLAACQTLQDHEKERVVSAEELKMALAGKPAELHGDYRILLAQGERNAVLNHARIGVKAFEMGDIKLARRELAAAADRIETVYADNTAAKQALGKFVKENIKDFKGEPYERAMVFYYLGLAYLAEGDFENARASFKAGEFQDTLSTEEEYQADFALLNYLSGWASKCNGDDELAEDAFSVAHEHRHTLAPPEASMSTLVIYESGQAPAKFAAGKYDEQLKVRRGYQTGIDEITYDPDGLKLTLNMAANVYWQASSRGGREIDTILAGKAKFKDGMDATGTVLAQVGAGTALYGAGAGNRDAALVGLGILVVGLIAKAAAEAAQPDADIRYIDVLPDTVTLAATGSGAAPGSFSGRGAEVVQAFPGETCGLIWARDVSIMKTLPVRAPNSAAPAT
ncbi:hypothetical protein [Nisaea denitrificans]|uniref:hypothetical protein n=1 Tax=Nisaea denitrificans TaxID=390877 RepID=UPI000408F346|nr:hypothetical protein [Nisaea denitrificans]